jgi:hypothetical protein
MEIMAVGIGCADYVTSLYPQKAGINFTDKWWSLGWYGSLPD